MSMYGIWYSESPPRDGSSCWLDYPSDGTRFTLSKNISLSKTMTIDISLDSPEPLRLPQYVLLVADKDRRAFFVDDYHILWDGTQNAIARCELVQDNLMTAIEQGFVVRGNVGIFPVTNLGTVQKANFDVYPTIATSYPGGTFYNEFQRTTTVIVYTLTVGDHEIYQVAYHPPVDNFIDLTDYWDCLEYGTVGGANISRFIGAWIAPFNKVKYADGSHGEATVKIGPSTWHQFGNQLSSSESVISHFGAIHSSNTYAPDGVETLRIGNAMTNVTVTTGMPITINYGLSISPSEEGVIQTLEVNGTRLNLTESTSVPLRVTVGRDITELQSLNNTLSAFGSIVQIGAGVAARNPIGALSGVTSLTATATAEAINTTAVFTQNGQASLAVSQNLNNETTFLGAVGIAKLAWTSDADYISACEHEYGYTITNFGLIEFFFLSPKNWFYEGFVQISHPRISYYTDSAAIMRAVSAKDIASYLERGVYFYYP